MTDLPKEFDADRLGQMILNSLDGSSDDQEVAELNDVLRKSTTACEFYLEFIEICTSIRQVSNKTDFTVLDNNLPLDSNVSLRGLDLSDLNIEADTEEPKCTGLTQDMLEVLELERTSPSVDIPKEESKRELIQKVERDFKWFPGDGNKALTRAYLALVASIMVFIGYLHFFVPNNVDLPVVASLADSVKAVWDNELQMPDEFGDMVQSRYGLKEGYASILFNDGAKVTVEAPAELSLNSSGEMELFIGRIYAIVPQKAHGFAVKAASNKVVDLGTEFGIELDNSGNTQLHVTKGRTMLFAGLIDKNNKPVEVGEGAAKKVYNDGFVKDIPCNKTQFVNRIDSKKNFIWKGKNSIDLADIISGGNGFGAGRKGFCIMPDTGSFTATDESPLGSDPSGVTKFKSSYMRPVPDLPGVDCVIVPGYQASGDLPLTTTGITIPDFPELTGSLRWRIQTQPYRKDGLVILNGKRYCVDDNPAILMHASCGITFDLNKIRQSIPGLSIASFKMLCGINEAIIAGKYDPEKTVDVYVFLDGRQVLYQSIQHVENNAVPLEIDLSGSTGRFMTLLVTSGKQSNSLDHCVFGVPELIIGD